MRLILALCSILVVAAPASAARVGLDDRNASDGALLLGSGSELAGLRSLLEGLGHTLVPMTSFGAASIAAADVEALYLGQPFAPGAYSASEIGAIQQFVAGGGGLVLHADGGGDAETASMDSLGSAFGVSFAPATTEADGHLILLFEAHPVTAGVPSLLEPASPVEAGFCVAGQRVLTIGSPAVDLTVLGMGDDALAAVTGSGGAGNVVIVSDAGAFSDSGSSGSSIGIQGVRLEVCANRRIATNIATFVIP